MGKRTCSDMETADESVQKDVQPEQHEEAQPKRKAKGFDLVSGGANCKQTSAVLCDLWHNFQVLHARPADALGRNAAQSRGRQRHAVCKECLGRADGGVEEKCKTWEAKREFALKLATDKTASFIRVTQTEALRSQSEVSDVIWVAANVGRC